MESDAASFIDVCKYDLLSVREAWAGTQVKFMTLHQEPDEFGSEQLRKAAREGRRLDA